LFPQLAAVGAHRAQGVAPLLEVLVVAGPQQQELAVLELQGKEILGVLLLPPLPVLAAEVVQVVAVGVAQLALEE
jgi:hypothetical protein